MWFMKVGIVTCVALWSLSAGGSVTTMVAQWPDKADDEEMRVNVAVSLGFVRRRRKEVVGKEKKKR